MCVSPAKKSTVVTCNNKTWARFIEFVLQWQHLEGSQAEIAQSFVQAHAADIERYGNCMAKLYGQKNTTDVNAARYNMFRLSKKSEIAMPPNQDSLGLHIQRANYQAGMYMYMCMFNRLPENKSRRKMTESTIKILAVLGLDHFCFSCEMFL